MIRHLWYPLTLSMLFGACATEPSVADRAKTGNLRDQLAPCHLASLGEPALCGTYEVWEDRVSASGRRIALRVVVVPSRLAEPEPDPVFLFAGGPGQAITEVGPFIVRALAKVRRKRDFVLIDQRGTGRSNSLDCEPPDDEKLSAGEAIQRYFQDELQNPKEIAECLDGLDADPRHYMTAASVEDFDEVREALGYARINVWGASYGTRVALVYMRRHPERIRAAVLDSVAPTTMPLPLFVPRDAQRSFDLLIDACADNQACNSAYPRLGDAVAKVLKRLEQPTVIETEHPRTGEQVTLSIDRDTFASGLRGILYSSEFSAILPLMVFEAASGNFGPFVAAVTTFGESTADGMSAGLMLSVLCAEDLPRVSDEDASRESADSFVGDAPLMAFREACALWPHGAAESGFGEPVRSDTPVLLLSGALDPVTPPIWADETAEHLSNSLSIVVPGHGHGVTTVGCVPSLVAEFIDTASAGDLDVTCVDKRARPPFFVSFAGPKP